MAILSIAAPQWDGPLSNYSQHIEHAPFHIPKEIDLYALDILTLDHPYVEPFYLMKCNHLFQCIWNILDVHAQPSIVPHPENSLSLPSLVKMIANVNIIYNLHFPQ